jgi:hypothetical protein
MNNSGMFSPAPINNNTKNTSGIEMQPQVAPNFSSPRNDNTMSAINNSNLGRSESPIGTPKRGMSAKQRRFYERLQQHKKIKGSSPSPIRNNSRVQINRGMEVHYDSQVPEQEKIFDPSKSINLMVQDPYGN